MARTPRITPEMLVDAGVQLVLEEGIGALNIRSLAARLGCSIQPIFRNFGSMDALKAEILRGLDTVYQDFIAQYVNKSDYLFTISLAHVALAREQRNLFAVMFLTGAYGTRTVEQIIQSSWNRETIECTADQYGLSLAQAEAVYRDVRFYTFGIAQSVYAGTVTLEDGEAESLLRGAIARFSGRPQG